MPPEDDPLLREVAAWARDRAAVERQQLDEKWDRLAAGALSPEEEAELRADAENSARGAATLAAFQPLGPQAEARIVAQVRAQRAAERSNSAAASVVASPPAVRAGNVLPFRRRVTTWVGGLVLAAAAVLIAVVLLPTVPGPLPSYTAELSGGVQIERGGRSVPASGIRTFARGAHFDLVLRPARAVPGLVVVRCLLVAAGGAPRPFPACDDAQRSKDGSLRVAGTVGNQIEYLSGDWTLWAIVARPGGLPKDPPVTGIAKPIAGEGWIGIPTSIRFAATT